MADPKVKLSRRQEQILDFVRENVLTKGFPPSIREIGESVGLSSSSTVHSHLRSLEKKKLLERDPSRPRSMRLVEPPPTTWTVVGYCRGTGRSFLDRVAGDSPAAAARTISTLFPASLICAIFPGTVEERGGFASFSYVAEAAANLEGLQGLQEGANVLFIEDEGTVESGVAA